MQKYILEERIKILIFYLENQRSIYKTQLEFRKFYNVKKSPSGATIRSIFCKFEKYGSVGDSSRSGRPPSSRTNENIELVRASVAEDASTSTRKRSTQLKIGETSLRRILHQDLKMYPYKIQMTQRLTSDDYAKRMEYSQQFIEKDYCNESFLLNLWMSDEAHFHIGGCVNKQNARFWSTVNPQITYESTSHPQKVTVWCAISQKRIIGPYFFEENGASVMVNGNRYRQMIEEFFIPNLGDDIEDAWFQQDGATAHTSKASMQLLRKHFGNRIISRNSDFPWPPRSPDLTAPDFFLWGYLKQKVYINKPHTLTMLKKNIEEEITAIAQTMLVSTMRNVLKRAEICKRSGGHHLKDIIFKK